MNSRTETLVNEFVPQVAIVVYKAEGDNFYLESHTINKAGQLTEGKPLLQETMQEVVDVFFDERKGMLDIKGMLPENLLSFEPYPGGNYKMIWYRPAEIRVLHFAKALKLPTAKAWVPAVIYKVERGGLDVYALKSNARPKEETKLFIAPFHNVSDDGDVCLGNAKVAKPRVKTYENLMKYYEDLFWLSEFTHRNGNNKTKDDMNVVWKNLLTSKEQTKWSDINQLQPYKNKTLKSIL